MHFERGSIEQKSVDTIKQAKAAGGRVIAVGTTSVRVLETAAADGELKPWEGETNLFIKPPYQFKSVDGMLTNFHLPRSTLLVMIRTFGGQLANSPQPMIVAITDGRPIIDHSKRQ